MPLSSKAFVPKGEFKSTAKRSVERLSRAQAAEAATKSALAIADDPDFLVELVVDLLSGFSKGGGSGRLRTHINGKVAQLLHDQKFVPNYDSAADSQRDITDHEAYIDDLLNPGGRVDVAHFVETSLLVKTGLARSHEYLLFRHAERLDALKRHHPELYAKVLDGRLGEVAALVRMTAKQPQPRRIALTLRMQAYLLVIRTALDFAQTLRSLVRMPLGNRFASLNTWPTTGSVLAATVSGPARIVVDMANTPQKVRANASFDEVVRIATQKKWIMPGANGGKLAEIAQRVNERLDANGEAVCIEQVFQALAQAATKAIFSREDLQKRGFANSDFSHYRMGLTVTQAATYVSMTMQRALSDADRITCDLFPAEELPASRPPVPTRDDTRAGAYLLRGSADLDRHASPQGGEYETKNRTGRKPLAALATALSHGTVAQKAADRFQIDVEHWFKIPQ